MLIIQQLGAQTAQTAPSATAASAPQADRAFFIRRLGDG
jgi:hypothetical protein